MPRQVQDDRPQTLGWVGSLEEIEQLQLTLGNEVVEESWGGPNRPWFDWQVRVLTSTVDELGLFGGKVGGKAQPLDADVWTPYGVKQMGEIRVGDSVCNPDGSNSRVLLVHPQGKKKILKVTFSDGSSTRCTEDHLWLIRPTSQKLKAKRKWIHDTEYVTDVEKCRLYTTSELRSAVAHQKMFSSSKGTLRYSFQVPLCNPINFAGSVDKLLDPYVLGVLLGDGNLSQSNCLSLSALEYQIVDEVGMRLGIELQKSSGKYNWRIPMAYAGHALREYKLMGCKSYDKFIPHRYFKLPVQDRLDLLAGLIDTDGYVDEQGHLSFTTVSPGLCRGVKQLARGLGARVSVSLKTTNGYKDKFGEFVHCQDSYTLHINSPLVHQMVKLDRKKDRLLSVEKYSRWKSITDITDDGEEDAQCITVDNPNGLYITDDFTVTHNSTVMRGWLVSGNPTEPDEDDEGIVNLVNKSYIYHPDYLGLILRRNEKDLTDFLIRAQRMYSPLGGEYVNGYFRFPAYTKDGMKTSQLGARIDCGHMKDSSAWQKYIGTEYQRVAIDEAPLIPEYSLIEELRSCMRTPHKNMRIQIMYAGNAGGPGTSWILDRFMRSRDKDGKIIPHDTVITENYTHPFTGEIIERSRIWMFSTISENPIMRDTAYAVTLMALTDPKMRAAYYEGRWDALFGSYFSDLFRPEGPQANEPSTACHVIFKSKETKTYPKELRPWWPISMGGDWAYSPHDAAFLWARKTPEGQVVIYDELCVSQVLPTKLGVEIAQRSKKDLELLPSHSFNLYLGHDAFAGRDGDRTIAELIAAGIAKVLGPDSVYVPDVLITKLKETWEKDALNWQDEQKRDKAIEQIKLHRRQGITIKKAEKTGIIGWQHCRESLRFEHNIATNIYYDEQIANKLLRDDPKAFEEYAKLYRNIRPEVLPKLQILDCCPLLIEAIPKAQHEDGTENVSKNHFRGKDLVDCWLYLMLGIDDESPQEPFEVYRDRKISELTKLDPSITVNDLCRINMVLEDEWKKDNRSPLPCTPPRGPRARRMHKMGILKGEDRWQQIRNTTRY